MPVPPVTVAAAAGNITEMLPVVQDAFIYGANFVVSHPIGLLAVTMTLLGFGVNMAMKIVRGRRGRR